MLRILVVAAALFLTFATSAQAGSATVGDESVTVQLQIGARVNAQAFLQPVVRASMPTVATNRAINGGSEGQDATVALFGLGGEKPALALPVSDSVSLGLGYQYLRREDVRFEVAETGSLDEGYSSHNVVLRANWRF